MLRGTQNRFKMVPGTLSGDPVACKSVPKASPERLGSVPECPESCQGTRDARTGALERLGACRGDQNRHRVASESGKIEISSCSAFAKHRRSDFSSIFIDFRCFGEVCEPLKVLRMSAKTEVWPFALGVEWLERCNLEKLLKPISESTQDR